MIVILMFKNAECSYNLSNIYSSFSFLELVI